MNHSPKKRVPKEVYLVTLSDGWLATTWWKTPPRLGPLEKATRYVLPTPRSSDEKRRLEKLRDAVVEAAMRYHTHYVVALKRKDLLAAGRRLNRDIAAFNRACARLELFNRSKRGKRNATQS